MNNLFIIALVFGFLFGGIGGLKLGKINPFKGKQAIIQKSQGIKESYFKDKIKGIEYSFKESQKTQNSVNAATNATIGQKIGNVIDNGLRFIIMFFIIGIALLFLTGINVFKFVKDRIKEVNKYRKALKQTVKAVEHAKPKMNGSENILKNELSKEMDVESKSLVNEMKNE